MSPPPLRFRLSGEVDGRRRSFLLAPGRHTVGSAVDQRIVLAVTGISRRHAVIRVEDEVRVEDLASKNGVFIGGRRIDRETTVVLGETIEFGSVALALEQVEIDDVELGLDLSDGTTTESRPRSSGSTTRTEQTSSDIAGRTVSLERRDPSTGLLIETLDRLWSLPETEASLTAFARETFSARAVALIEHLEGAPTVLATAGDAGDWPESGDEPGELGFSYLGFEIGEADGRGVRGRLQLPDRALDLILWQPSGLDAVMSPLLHLMLLWSGRRALEQQPFTNGEVLSSLRFPEGHVVGESAPMRTLYDQLAKVAPGDLPVLLLGETGVGKEHIARLLHLSSPRHRGPLVAVNCAAIPSDLLEAELFGITGGVATGVRARLGKLEAASSGTLLLDEIGDMPAALQAKLLRVLQEKKVEPLGGAAVDLDVRVVAATHADLRERVEQGAFRRDLYYRLAGFEARIPPLRERRGDISRLIEHFARRFCDETGKKIRGFTVKALRALLDHPWPGNVRELEHEVRRLVYLAQDGDVVDWQLLSEALRQPGGSAGGEDSADEGPALVPRLEALERRLIIEALEAKDGNQTHAAQHLDISRNGLIQRMKRLDIPPSTGR